ncbi:MAG TPA: methyltransferase domain-containing protein [Gemmatimonadales bacterium]|jgi:SAM-dependent methyltransferase
MPDRLADAGLGAQLTRVLPAGLRMTDPAPREQVEAAASYQDKLVPALMEEWAPRVAEAARIHPGDRVLDVACGTGVLARAAARRAAPGGSVTGLDLANGMLAIAARLSPDITWRQGSANDLPFPDRTFDAVVSQFGLMFFPDPAGALREMMRVLVPGGRLAVAVWGSLADTPAYAAEVALAERHAGSGVADVLREPFVMGEGSRLADLFHAAGISGATVGLRPGRGRFPSIRSMVEVDVRDWLPLVGIVLDDGVIEEILAEAETALKRFVVQEGAGVTFASPAVVATASKPT